MNTIQDTYYTSSAVHNSSMVCWFYFVFNVGFENFWLYQVSKIEMKAVFVAFVLNLQYSLTNGRENSCFINRQMSFFNNAIYLVHLFIKIYFLAVFPPLDAAQARLELSKVSRKNIVSKQTYEQSC